MLDRGRILVTGGAGFIGSALVWGLNQMGLDQILIADRLEIPGQWRNLRALQFEDYIDADELAARFTESPRAFGGLAAVLHLGAFSSTTEQDTRSLLRNNYAYSQRIASWAVSMQSRFLYASSAATYGAFEGIVSEDLPLESLRPLSAYGYFKHLFDLWANRTGILEHAVGVKYFNVFGPNEEHKGAMRSMVSQAYDQVRSSGVVRLFSSERPEYRDGEQLRDFLYVKDAVAMTLHLAGTPAAHGLFNLGSGRAHTWLDLVSPVFVACGLPRRIEFIDMPPTLRGQYQYHTCACIDRLRASGYDKPVTTLDRAVAEDVGGYLMPGLRLGDEERRLKE
jgi:ADP-L-glycero-D-manno-heptose 6-epimerase